MGTVCRLPAGQEPVQAAKDGLIVEATGLLQPQDALEGGEVVATGSCTAAATFGLMRGIMLVRNVKCLDIRVSSFSFSPTEKRCR